jgi:TRAP-type C4-dicarboxylate transport system permease small subunit
MTLLDRAVGVTVGALLLVLVITAFGQVVARYVFGQPFTWVLELDMLLMVWAVFLSGYVGVRRDTHLKVEYFVTRLSASKRARVILAGRLGALVFVAVLGWKSFDIIDAMDGITFTSMPVGMPVLYWSVPIGAALMALALVEALVRDWRTLAPFSGR